MNTEELFEELGYEFEKEYTSDGVNDTYRYNKCSGSDSIIFDLNGKNIIINKIFHAISLNELQAIIQQCKELGWLEEKQAIKSETNFEHYFEYLSTRRMSDFALIDGRVTKCSVTHCSECDFNGDCVERKLKWLVSTFKKPTYKLNQFEYDLIQTFDRCKECCLLNEIECLKKLTQKGTSMALILSPRYMKSWTIVR